MASPGLRTLENPLRKSEASWRWKFPSLVLASQFDDLKKKPRGSLTDARAEREDALLPPGVRRLLQPLSSVVVCAPKPMASDMLVGWKLGQSPLEFLSVQIQCVVVNILTGPFKGLEEEVDLAQVTAILASGSVPTMAAS